MRRACRCSGRRPCRSTTRSPRSRCQGRRTPRRAPVPKTSPRAPAPDRAVWLEFRARSTEPQISGMRQAPFRYPSKASASTTSPASASTTRGTRAGRPRAPLPRPGLLASELRPSARCRSRAWPIRSAATRPGSESGSRLGGSPRTVVRSRSSFLPRCDGSKWSTATRA